MAASPLESKDVEHPPSGEDDGDMNIREEGAGALGEFEVKEQDRWLPIANGECPTPPSCVTVYPGRRKILCYTQIVTLHWSDTTASAPQCTTTASCCGRGRLLDVHSSWESPCPRGGSSTSLSISTVTVQIHTAWLLSLHQLHLLVLDIASAFVHAHPTTASHPMLTYVILRQLHES